MTPSKPRFRAWLATALAAVWLLATAAAALALIPPAVDAPAQLAEPETRVWDFDFVEIEQRQCSQEVSRGPPLGSYEHTYFVGEQGVWVHNDCATGLSQDTYGRLATNGPRCRESSFIDKNTDRRIRDQTGWSAKPLPDGWQKWTREPDQEEDVSAELIESRGPVQLL